MDVPNKKPYSIYVVNHNLTDLGEPADQGNDGQFYANGQDTNMPPLGYSINSYQHVNFTGLQPTVVPFYSGESTPTIPSLAGIDLTSPNSMYPGYPGYPTYSGTGTGHYPQAYPLTHPLHDELAMSMASEAMLYKTPEAQQLMLPNMELDLAAQPPAMAMAMPQMPQMPQMQQMQPAMAEPLGPPQPYLFPSSYYSNCNSNSNSNGNSNSNSNGMASMEGVSSMASVESSIRDPNTNVGNREVTAFQQDQLQLLQNQQQELQQQMQQQLQQRMQSQEQQQQYPPTDMNLESTQSVFHDPSSVQEANDVYHSSTDHVDAMNLGASEFIQGSFDTSSLFFPASMTDSIPASHRTEPGPSQVDSLMQSVFLPEPSFSHSPMNEVVSPTIFSDMGSDDLAASESTLMTSPDSTMMASPTLDPAPAPAPASAPAPAAAPAPALAPAAVAAAVAVAAPVDAMGPALAPAQRTAQTRAQTRARAPAPAPAPVPASVRPLAPAPPRTPTPTPLRARARARVRNQIPSRLPPCSASLLSSTSALPPILPSNIVPYSSGRFKRDRYRGRGKGKEAERDVEVVNLDDDDDDDDDVQETKKGKEPANSAGCSGSTMAVTMTPSSSSQTVRMEGVADNLNLPLSHGNHGMVPAAFPLVAASASASSSTPEASSSQVTHPALSRTITSQQSPMQYQQTQTPFPYAFPFPATPSSASTLEASSSASYSLRPTYASGQGAGQGASQGTGQSAGQNTLDSVGFASLSQQQDRATLKRQHSFEDHYPPR